MGASCCCFHGDDLNDRQCISFQCLAHQFRHLYSLIFRRGQTHLPVPGNASLASQVVPPPDTFMCETFRAPPRPLPYDLDPRCSHSLQSGSVSKQGKASSHCIEETEPLRRSDSSCGEQLSDAIKGSDSEMCPDFSIVHPLVKYFSGEGYMLNSWEDEDVCPTCLEEYSTENPKIITKCFHHYHLGCILEWMERSETCPVCGKIMVYETL